MTISNKSWLAAYLFYAEPWEKFLADAVKPYAESVLANNLAEQFFFIRYWERGPHIRLRFKGNKDVLENELEPSLVCYFSNYFDKYPSTRREPDWAKEAPHRPEWFPNNSVQFIEYEPEVERYGGPVGILIAEKQFQASSRAVLEIIHENKNWDYDRALGAAIQLHLGFARALGMDLPETTAFYRYIFSTWFSSSYGFEKNMAAEETQKRRELTIKAFEEGFGRQQDTLSALHKTLWTALAENSETCPARDQEETEFEQAWLNDWLREMTMVGNLLKKAQEETKLIYPEWFKPNPEINASEGQSRLRAGWPILNSCVHMTNNRLGILNRDEAYLGYLIKRSLEVLSIKDHNHG